ALGLPLMTDPALWRQTMAARLLRDGSGQAALPVPGFLALVAVATNASGRTTELYRRVEGAVLEAPGARSLQVVVIVQGEDGTKVRWMAGDTRPPGATGAPRVRVPYVSPEGLLEATSVISLEVFVDGSRSDFLVPASSVELGQVLTLP
ncbi:MAG: hypothetical protein ACI8WY_000791, partial [Planctomycetota bacterium]